MPEKDNLDITCKKCPLNLPSHVAFMRTVGMDDIGSHLEEAELDEALEILREQAGEAMDEFKAQLPPDADKVYIAKIAQEKFGAARASAIEQAKAKYSKEWEELNETILESMPGLIACQGMVEVDGQIYCGASIQPAISEEGLETQASHRRVNEEFVERQFIDWDEK